MSQNSTESFVFPASPVGTTSSGDVLTEILRDGARQLLGNAIEAEVGMYLAERAELVDEKGHQLVVRNGHLPERRVMTGIGAVPVTQPRFSDLRSPSDR